MNAAAIILAAGKGTRMGDATINKVCFDCAGVPVIRRIVQNMRAGGVERFVIVVGHLAETVMSALSEEEGIQYAFQKEQKGTDHAAQCGLNVLKDIGFNGPVIVSMGDKIVAPDVIRGLLAKMGSAGVVANWGVQFRDANPNGGRIVIVDGTPRGVVELADIGLMALHDLTEDQWPDRLARIGLNTKKAAKVMDRRREITVSPTRYGQTADEIASAKYSNAGLYCFDSAAAMEALGAIRSDNAQGEIYLTDALEYFASRGQNVSLYEVASSDDMLTYSTPEELASMVSRFNELKGRFVS